MNDNNISRRSFAKGIAPTLAALPFLKPGLTQNHQYRVAKAESDDDDGTDAKSRLQIGMLLYPGLSALDLIGPHPFFAELSNCQVHLLWKDKNPVVSSLGYSLVPTTSIKDCPRDLDVLFVPGGTSGTFAMMDDEEILSFLAERAGRARYVTSVCTGSLILGAAGLLTGYRATSHWRFRDLLPLFGATPVEERVVTDRNRVTGGGVTAGIDFGLVIASRLRGRRAAEVLQLYNEYDPHPPFAAGTPAGASVAIKDEAYSALAPAYDQGRAASVRARARRQSS
ncbi:MAG TPA: DJ-1/PfpI family protein [Terriglobales bacterium]|nr:DJ-1/PfpI family protein [Terriglobales bacterium]